MGSHTQNRNNVTIFSKLMQLPVVHSTVGFVRETYSNIKHQNKAFEVCIGAAESSVCTVTSGLFSLTYVGFVRESSLCNWRGDAFNRSLACQYGYLEYADAGCCTWLDGMQRKHPLLTSPTEKVVAYAKEYGEDALSNVANKVFHVAPARYMLRITDILLGRAEKWMRKKTQKAIIIRSFRRTLRRLRRNAVKQRQLAVKNFKGRKTVTPKKKVRLSYRIFNLPRWILGRLGVVSVSKCLLTMPSSIDNKNDNFHKSPGAKRKYEAIESESEDGEGLEVLDKIDEYVSSEDPDYVKECEFQPSEEESTDSLEYRSDVEDEIPATNVKDEKTAENFNKTVGKESLSAEQSNNLQDQHAKDQIQENSTVLPSEE